MNTLSQQLRILYYLVARDLYVWRKKIGTELIDACVVAISDILLFGIMLPSMGMSSMQATAYYIGTTVQIAFMAHYYHAVTLVLEYVEQDRVQFDLLLPIHLITLIIRFIIIGVVRATILTLLPLAIGLYYFGVAQSLTILSNITLLLFIMGTQITLSTLFVGVGLTQPSQWLFSDAWPRFLGPMMNLGCLFFMFKDIKAIYPRASYFFLSNPLVSITEGLRSLTNLPFALPLGLCITLLTFFSCLFFVLTYKKVQKSLDCLS